MSGDPFWQIITQQGYNVAPALRAFHQRTGTSHWQGKCNVETGQGWLVSLLLKLGGFPPAGRDIDIAMTIQTTGRASRWTRQFGRHKMISKQTLADGGVAERLGPITLIMSLEACDQGLDIRVPHLRFLGVPMPAMLLPRGVSHEYQDAEGRFCFDIGAELPMLGRLIRYHGWLRPV